MLLPWAVVEEEAPHRVAEVRVAGQQLWHEDPFGRGGPTREVEPMGVALLRQHEDHFWHLPPRQHADLWRVDRPLSKRAFHQLHHPVDS